MLKVLKFGGSSLANAQQFKKVADIIRSDKSRRYIIASAPGKRFDDDEKVTDLFYKCQAKAVSGEDITAILSQIKERYDDIIEELCLDFSLNDEFEKIKNNIAASGADYAASRGEYLNGMLLADYLGVQFVDTKDIILFDERGNLLNDESKELISDRLKDLDYAVLPGFYGSNKSDGKIKTFSRGGSDITGSLVAKAVNSDIYENWTDVSGVLVADPRVISNPEKIDVITYTELRELSYMGATVLHEDAIFPVRTANIPINIKNTNEPDDSGTMIVSNTCQMPKYTITGIAGKKNFVSISIQKEKMNNEIGFVRKVLQVFEEHNISIEHMPSGIDTFSVFVKQEDFMKNEQSILHGINKAVAPDLIELEPNIALIAVVGRGMKATRGTSARIFSALAHARINVRMIDQGSGEMNIIVGIENGDFEAAIRAIYNIFVVVQL